jgi:hypothetical protein
MSGLYGINLLGFAKVKKNCICICVINEDFETAAQLQCNPTLSIKKKTALTLVRMALLTADK